MSCQVVATLRLLLEIGSKDMSVGWYDKLFPGVTPDARELLEEYAHVLGAEVDKYVLEMVLLVQVSLLPRSRN